MLYLKRNQSNELVISKGLGVDVSAVIDYTLVFKGLSDNNTYLVTGLVNVSPQPDRFYLFTVDIPTDIDLTEQQYILEVWAYTRMTGFLVNNTLVEVGLENNKSIAYHTSNQNKFYK